jgi:hypothetical protein
MPLKAGSKKIGFAQNPDYDNYDGSMAEAMEKAFEKEWPFIMGSAPKPPSSPEMQLLFIAIAQGVVKHLVSNASAIQILVSPMINHAHPAHVAGIIQEGTLH